MSDLQNTITDLHPRHRTLDQQPAAISQEADVAAYLVQDEPSGAPTLLDGAKQQIQERDAVRQNLQMERDTYADLYDLAPISYLVLTASGHIQRLNQLGVDLLGGKYADLLGLPFERCLADRDRDAFAQHLRLCARTERPQTLDVALAGQRRGAMVRLTSVAVRDATRQVVAYRVAAVDLYDRGVDDAVPEHDDLAYTLRARTAELEAAQQRLQAECTLRTRAEDQLQATEALCTILQRQTLHIENSPLGVVEFNRDLCVERWSKQAERIFGWKAEEVTGKHFDEIGYIFKDDMPYVWGETQRLMSETVVRNVLRNRNYTKDGRVISCEWYNSVLYDEEGRLVSILSHVVDVTERVHVEDALRTNETRLRLALTAAHMGLWDFDFVSGYISLSLEAGRILQDERLASGVPWETVLSLIHPDDQYAIEHKIRAASAQSEDLFIEARLLRDDGSISWIEAHARVLRNAEGRATALLGVLSDITERKQAEESHRELNVVLKERVRERTLELEIANRIMRNEIDDRERAEEALRESQRFITSITDSTPNHVYVFDPFGRGLIYANRPTYTDLGYTLEMYERLGIELLATLMHPVDFARVPAIHDYYRSMQDGEVFENEYRMRHVNGEWRWFSSRDIVFSRTSDGQTKLMLGTAQDITDRKKAEEALKDAYARLEILNADLRYNRDLLRTLFDNFDDGLALIDHDGSVLAANQALTRFVGKAPYDLVGRLWETYCSLTSPIVNQTFRDGMAQRKRGRYIAANGRNYMVDIRTFPLFGDEERISRVVLHIVDVTERLQLEELAIQNERLAASGRLAAIVAHEVNTPLQAIQNFLFLASTAGDRDRSNYLNLVHDEIERVGTLIRRLLDLHRPDDGSLKPIDGNALIERVLLLTGSTLARHRITVERNLSPNLPSFQGRSDHMTQVLLNLILNAIDAMPKGGALSLRTTVRETNAAATPEEGKRSAARRSKRSMLVIELEDTGQGIPPDVQTRIFEPFFTTKSHGSGLGLAISQQIIVQHGGEMRVNSFPGNGTKFTIMLPLAKSSARLRA